MMGTKGMEGARFSSRSRRRGNPNWGKPMAYLALTEPVKPTEWEAQLVMLGLSESSVEHYLVSSRGTVLHRWIDAHCANRFVPEKILKLLDLNEYVRDRLAHLEGFGGSEGGIVRKSKYSFLGGDA